VSDPLSLVPFALAARDGVIDGWPVRQLVSAGVGVLRGSAALVRSLAGKQSAILLPPGPLVFTALAASDGRAAILLDPFAPVDARRLLDQRVGACFTTSAFEGLVPPGIPRVLLDESPSRAYYADADRRTRIDLFLHEGVPLEGDPDATGSNEPMLLVEESDGGTATFTHRAVLVRARRTMALANLVASDHVLVVRAAHDASTLAAGEVAALLAGARVTTAEPGDALERLEQLDVTVMTARATVVDTSLASVVARGTRVDAPALRALVCAGPQLPDAARVRWHAATGLDRPWIAAPDA
jgi:hypothetical protein